MTKRAARADPRPPLLAAPEIAPTGQRLPRGSASAGGERVVSMLLVHLARTSKQEARGCSSYSETNGFTHAIDPAAKWIEKTGMLVFLELL